MRNFAMQAAIRAGDCINLEQCRRNEDGDYVISVFIENVDYCDAATEEWIWSIGRHNSTGQILASTSGKFYQNPDFTCLYLK